MDRPTLNKIENNTRRISFQVTLPKEILPNSQAHSSPSANLDDCTLQIKRTSLFNLSYSFLSSFVILNLKESSEMWMDANRMKILIGFKKYDPWDMQYYISTKTIGIISFGGNIPALTVCHALRYIYMYSGLGDSAQCLGNLGKKNQIQEEDNCSLLFKNKSSANVA